MKKVTYVLIVSLVVVSGLVFANREFKNEPSKTSTPKPPSAAEKEAARKNWEASPEGIKYKNWEASPAGKKVLDGAAKIRKHIDDSTSMEAVITDLSLPPGSRVGFGIMAKINGEDYILSFGVQESKEFEPLHNLKVNDKIKVISRSVSHAPKYAYPILRGDYVEKDGKVIYKRTPRKGGC